MVTAGMGVTVVMQETMGVATEVKQGTVCGEGTLRRESIQRIWEQLTGGLVRFLFDRRSRCLCVSGSGQGARGGHRICRPGRLTRTSVPLPLRPPHVLFVLRSMLGRKELTLNRPGDHGQLWWRTWNGDADVGIQGSLPNDRGLCHRNLLGNVPPRFLVELFTPVVRSRPSLPCVLWFLGP